MVCWESSVVLKSKRKEESEKKNEKELEKIEMRPRFLKTRGDEKGGKTLNKRGKIKRRPLF